MRINGIMVAVLAALSANAFANNVSGEMLLRDAHYWYNFPLDGSKPSHFLGAGCDVLQLVLDVNTGYTDIAGADIAGTVGVSPSDLVAYPDRITAAAQMFSYTLYSNAGLKMYRFYDKNATASAQVGTLTAFAYCFSTNPNAYIQTYNGIKDKCYYTYGTTGGASLSYNGIDDVTMSHAQESTCPP